MCTLILLLWGAFPPSVARSLVLSIILLTVNLIGKCYSRTHHPCPALIWSSMRSLTKSIYSHLSTKLPSPFTEHLIWEAASFKSLVEDAGKDSQVYFKFQSFSSVCSGTAVNISTVLPGLVKLTILANEISFNLIRVIPSEGEWMIHGYPSYYSLAVTEHSYWKEPKGRKECIWLISHYWWKPWQEISGLLTSPV